MRILKLIIASVLVLTMNITWAEPSPIPMLQNSAEQIIDTLKQNRTKLKNNRDIIYSAVERHLVPHVDVIGMSRSVLGREAWGNASAGEKQEFTKAFTRLVIRTYASPLAEYTDETVKFSPIRGALTNRFVRVNSTIIRTKGNNIPLGYSLVNKNGEWKIYDLTVEGVSLLQSFRSQFSRALKQSSISDLVKQMNSHGKVS